MARFDFVRLCLPVSAYAQVALGCPVAAHRPDSAAQTVENVGIIATTLPQSMTPTKRPEPRWPIGLALLTAWLLPATTARRTAHASLTYAWFVHFLAAVLTVATVYLLIAWWEIVGGYDPQSFADAFLRARDNLSNDLSRHPWEALLITGSVGLAVEAAFAAIALLAMSWGAQDERLRASYRNALRQTWVRTAHIVPIVLLVGVPGVLLNRAEFEWRSANPRPVWPSRPRNPMPPAEDPSYAQKTAEYQAAMQQYGENVAQAQVALRLWRGRRPWYAANGEPLVVAAGFLAALWFLWGLLRGVGAFRCVQPIVRPPMCEACGYNLTAIPLESRCPECGEAVSASLGPDARPGTAWQRRGEVGLRRAWQQCSGAVIRRPVEFARQIRLGSSGTDHRLFFALHLPVIFIIGVTGALAGALMTAPIGEIREELALFITSCVMFGVTCVGGTVVFTHLAVAAIGLFESLRHKRNLLPGTMQIACYLGGYLTLWAFFGALTGLLVLALEASSFFHTLERYTGIYRDMLAMWAWLLPNLACCVGYFILISRGTNGTQHANR